MATYQTGIATVYFVADNPNKVINDLVNETSPIYKYVNLKWTEPPQPGIYHVYWFIDGNWQSANTTTSSDELQLNPPSNATAVQLRTDNLYPSNTVALERHVKPETRTLTVTPRYDGVLLDWTPNTSAEERVEVQRNGTTVFLDKGSSYVHETGGTFKIRMVKGTGNDLLYGEFSNSVTESVLAPPPPRAEPEQPCDFFLGINRAGDEVLHICNPSVVPAAPSVDSGKTATDWFQDWVGVNVDYGENTYLHSMFDYVKCLNYVRITQFTDSVFRKFAFSDAIDGVTGSSVSFTPDPARFTMVVTVDRLGNRRGAAPVISREINANDSQLTVAEYDLGGYGFGESGAFYQAGDLVIRTGKDILSVEIYEFNISVVGNSLAYEPIKGAGIGIKLNPDEFVVGGANFDDMFMCYTGTAVPDEYVNSMNLSDPIIPTQGNVDGLGIFTGPSGTDTVQILGGSGGVGWDIEMTKGLIKRGGNTWFNAGRGRTRMRYSGVSTDHSTPVFTFDIPPHSVDGNGLSTVEETGLLSNMSIILDNDEIRSASCLVYSVTPSSWEYSGEQSDWDETFTDDRGIIGFSSFSTRTPFYRALETYRFGLETLPNGDPYWNTWYRIDCTFYLIRVNETVIGIEYDFKYLAYDGSAGKENSITIPGFSFSFVGLK